MRITACRIEGFGPFRDRLFSRLDHPVVVVQGPNESGKTSLFHFFREMLYGIEPPEAARHPYTPAGGERPLEGRLRYRLADGTQRTVHRRLRSAPQARLTEADSDVSIDLQNRPLPAVAHISRPVFSSVYALGGEDLQSLSGTAWEEVQARLLRMMSAPGVRSVAAVVPELESEAARHWTPDAAETEPRHESEAARLARRRRTLREQLRKAREDDRERCALHEEITELTQRLKALEEERADLKVHLRRAERLRPVHALVTKMEAHAERAGDLTPFEEVPDQPGPVLDRLEREIERYEEEVAQNEAARREAQATREAFTRDDRRVEREAEAIRAWVQKTSAHENRVEHREELLDEIEQINSVLDERARRLFDTPWSEALADALRALPDEEMEARVEAYRRIDSEVEALQVRADTLARKVDRRKRLWPWLAAVVLGAGALVAGGALGRQLLAGVGGGVLVVGLMQAFNVWSYNNERTERLGELDLEIEEKAEERVEKSAAIAELLDDLPLMEKESPLPNDELWETLQELRRQVEERGALRRQADALAERLEEAATAVTALAERCGLSQPEGTSLPETTAALEKRLRAAEARYQEAEAAGTRLEKLHRRRDELEPALEERRAQREALLKSLHRLDDDTAAAVEELKDRRRAARHAEQAREALFREHPDWEALHEEISALEEEIGDWTYADEDIVRMRERREEVAEEIRVAEKQRARNREEADRLSRTPAPADVASKLAAVQRRLEAAGRRRDRLALLATVLRRAEQSFRLRHQPDVVKQAGRFLRAITGGRYRRLVLEEEDRRLHVCRSDESPPEPVAAPLSQGLRDQVYVALRLALLDHLDEAQEALPVFLDEVFTTWDRRRRQEGYAVIEELAERRQVFVFTCHPALSEELQRRLNAHRLLLGAPSSAQDPVAVEAMDLPRFRS